jgi:hypothetical protein
LEVIDTDGCDFSSAPTTLVSNGVHSNREEPPFQRPASGFKAAAMAPHAFERARRCVARWIGFQAEAREPVQAWVESLDRSGDFGVRGAISRNQTGTARQGHVSLSTRSQCHH